MRKDQDGRMFKCTDKNKFFDLFKETSFPRRLQDEDVFNVLQPNLTLDREQFWASVTRYGGLVPGRGASVELEMFHTLHRVRNLAVVVDKSMFWRFYLGKWDSLDWGSLSLAFFAEDPGTLFKIFGFGGPEQCTLAAKKALADCLTNLELTMCTFLQKKAEGIFSALCEDLLSHKGKFAECGDTYTFGIIHAAIGGWFGDITLEISSTGFANHGPMFGMGALELLYKYLEHLLSDGTVCSAYPHQLAREGGWLDTVIYPSGIKNSSTPKPAAKPTAAKTTVTPSPVVPPSTASGEGSQDGGSPRELCLYRLAEVLGMKKSSGEPMTCTSGGASGKTCTHGTHVADKAALTKKAATHALRSNRPAPGMNAHVINKVWKAVEACTSWE
jgi:hypothetical protein